MIDYTNFAFWCNQNNRKLCRAIPALAPYLDRQYYQVPLVPNRKYVQRPYYGLYLSGKRFIENCAKYGFSSESYVQVIKDYYSLKEYYRLTDFYKFLEYVSQKESIRPFYTLHSGVNQRFKERYSFKDTLNYRDMVSLFNKMHADRQKSKKERDYQHKGNAIVYNPNKSFIYG